MQVSGGSTFVVSLPKRWARMHGLQGGTRVRMESREDGALVVQPSETKAAEQPPADIDASRLAGTSLLRTLIGLYLAGHDAILIHAAPRLSLDQREVVRRFTRICVGPEIVEETGQSVLVRDLVNPGEFTLRNALNRIHLITRSMLQDALGNLARADPEVARDIQSRDDEVDRIHRLVGKRLAKMLAGGYGARDPDLSLLEAHRIHQVSRLLERCADHASNIAHLTAANPGRAPRGEDAERLAHLGERAASLLTRAVDAFRGSDHQAANRVVDDSGQLLAGKARLREALGSGGNAPALTLLVESLERIHQYASDIAEIALNAPPAARSRKSMENQETSGARVKAATAPLTRAVKP